MKPEIKEAWVDALRSGKYKQGRGQLRRGDSYCCLGVLCDVVANLTEGKLVKWEESSGSVPGGSYHIGGMEGVLPDEVLEYADLPMECNEVAVHVGNRPPHTFSNTYTLIHANDDLKYTFKQIADIIEDQL